MTILRYCCCLLALGLLGCASNARTRHLLVAPYVPKNVYTSSPALPENWKRVAVFPLSFADTASVTAEAAYSLEPIWLAELRQQARFEIIPVSRAQLRSWTGRELWNTQEELPARFLEQIRTNTACDAVLFASLSAYRAYPPLRVGWVARLVDAQTAQTCWAIDEVFDAGDPAVMSGAEEYARKKQSPATRAADDPSLLRSPARFGQYTASAVASTLPARHNTR